MSDNPLLDLSGPPRFAEIRPEHAEPAVKARLAELEERIEALTAEDGPRTWAGLVAPLDQALEAVDRAWGPIQHLYAVKNDPALREVYRQVQPVVAEHMAKLGQHAGLCRAYQAVLDQAEAEGLDAVQDKILRDALRDFRLAGVDLPPAEQEQFRTLQVELSQLGTRFQDNLIDVERSFRLVVQDGPALAGLPEDVRAQARQKALEDDAQAPEGRLSFTLQMPSYLPFMQYVTDRALRQQMYRAYMTRATQGEHDNAPLIERILELRGKLARLLGFDNYAEVSLATKMAESPSQVHHFLSDLAEKALPYGKRDVAELAEFARARDGVNDLAPWDYAFYREALRRERYSFSDEEVRAYFPLQRVLDGLYQTLKRLYGIELREVTDTGRFQLWHPDVRVVEVRDAKGPRGVMLMDLFAREGKRQGAWMGECLSRRVSPGGVQDPVAYLVCNFGPPVGETPSLLRHGEVRTLFHECGHALHHVLTRVDHRQASGINMVPWDGVELPSQFHENWVWQKESLALLARHWQTGAELPAELQERMLAARNFQSGYDTLRQLEFALFDLELHTAWVPGGPASVHDVLESVRERVAVLPPPEWARFENGFAHIFAGGYAAGYYSYKWAEVLAADAFSRFEEEGIFSPAAGAAFREHILEKGGSEELMALYVAYRGREPSVDALLRQSGMA